MAIFKGMLALCHIGIFWWILRNEGTWHWSWTTALVFNGMAALVWTASAVADAVEGRW